MTSYLDYAYAFYLQRLLAGAEFDRGERSIWIKKAPLQLCWPWPCEQGSFDVWCLQPQICNLSSQGLQYWWKRMKKAYIQKLERILERNLLCISGYSIDQYPNVPDYAEMCTGYSTAELLFFPIFFLWLGVNSSSKAFLPDSQPTYADDTNWTNESCIIWTSKNCIIHDSSKWAYGWRTWWLTTRWIRGRVELQFIVIFTRI